MFRTMLGGKIHHAIVTEANLDYAGSITVDQDLLDAAGICMNGKVVIAGNNSGEHLEAYTILGERGSGVVCLGGTAMRLAQKGDIVITTSYVMLSEPGIAAHEPKVVPIDKNSKACDVISYGPPYTVLQCPNKGRLERFRRPIPQIQLI